MGVHQLSKVIGDNAPKAVKTSDMKSYFGKPPSMKGGELAKRADRRLESSKELAKAEVDEDLEAIEKFSKRLVKVTPQHNEDCIELLRLMGVPCISAPGEAEAQCAALAKSGKVFAVGTEDMDALAFGTPVLLRHLTFSEARKLPIQEFTLESILKELDLNMHQFIELCILLGCDYVDTIRGIGPKKALDLLRKHKSMDEVLKNLDKSKYSVLEDWPYKQAKQLFINPHVIDPETIELKWTEPDEEGLVQFMCHKHGFNEERIRNGAKKLSKAKNTSNQGRIDNFFSCIPSKPKNNSTAVLNEKKPSTNAQDRKRKSGLPCSNGKKKPK